MSSEEESATAKVPAEKAPSVAETDPAAKAAAAGKAAQQKAAAEAAAAAKVKSTPAKKQPPTSTPIKKPPPHGGSPNSVTVSAPGQPAYLLGTLIPKMGGVVNRGTYAIPWTGGTPDKHWNGLVNPHIVPKPNLMRSMDHKSALNYNMREAGLYPHDEEKKFKKGGKITSFIRDMHEFFVTHGMEAILYRQDPMSTKNYPPLINIMTEYARLNLHDMETQHDWFFNRYDDYDLNNSIQACKFLFHVSQFSCANNETPSRI